MMRMRRPEVGGLMAPQTRGTHFMAILVASLMALSMIAALAPTGNAGEDPLDSDGDGIADEDEREIAFVSKRHGNKEIYVMNSDGSDVRRLTTSPGADVTPTWNPERTMIAFASGRDGDLEIYVMDALDGDPVTKLTNNTSADTQPAWSNNPHTIAFSSNRDGDFDIYEMDATDGDPVVQVTNAAAADHSPTYSPDLRARRLRTLGADPQECDRIAFASKRTGNLDIFVTDGNSTLNLTANPAKDFEPDWFVGGGDDHGLVFSSNRDGDLDIWAVEAPPCAAGAARRALGTAGVFRVINQPRAQVEPSGRGANFTYAGNQSGNYEIYFGTCCPGSSTRITNSPRLDLNPDLSHFPLNSQAP
jgi:TolB protein